MPGLPLIAGLPLLFHPVPLIERGIYSLGFCGLDIFHYICPDDLKHTIMILSTTPTIEGHPILAYKGIVTGESIIGANFVKDFFAGIRDIIGGRSGSYEQVLREAKDTALAEMQERASSMGANAIVGIDIDYETVGQSGSMLMVAVSGTAVLI